ncbi:MAG: hypothetical protein RL154_1019 [Pseudomonadota bacterium]|jgi:hypothetical protein
MANKEKFKDINATLAICDFLPKVASKHIESETVANYKQLIYELLSHGYKIQAIVIDGKIR